MFAQQDPVDLYITDSIGGVNDEVVLSVKVNKFTNIIACQASINWDPTLLKFIGVSDFGIKQFGENDFGTTKAEQGHLRFAWSPTDAIAETIADSTILFKISFEIVSDNSDAALVDFNDIISETPFPIEFANDNYEILTVNTFEGKVSIFSDPSELVNLENTPNTSCDERNDNGSLKADVSGDSTTYTFNWFKGTSIGSTPDYIGYRYDHISGGDYALQVIDKNSAVFEEILSITVLDKPAGQADVISEFSKLSQSSCSTDPTKWTGAIEIMINEDQPENTYSISWWKDAFEVGEELTMHQNLYSAGKLDAGEYEIVAENLHTGCVSYHQTTVEEELVQFEVVLSSTKNNFCSDGANGSATAEVPTSAQLMNLQYYWFSEFDQIDTTQALHKGQIYENLIANSYTSWVIDLSSECSASRLISVEDSLIYTEAIITQKNDTLFANDDHTNWYRDSEDLQLPAEFFVPEKSGYYFNRITNEYGCQSQSETLFWGITGFKELEYDISIYPNPFNEFIRISNEIGLLEFVKIFDTQGVLVSENYNIENDFIDLYLTGSSNGIYLVKIQTDGKLYSRKVIKNRSK